MQLIRSIKKIRDFVKQQKKRNRTIGFVPTMGYLHEGHLSLVKQAKKDNDISILSIFVNPAQFGPKEDFKKYPRNLKHDIALAKKANVDVIFYPKVSEIYPKNYKTHICVEKLTKYLCGRSRPGHFQGVATIVTKLFNIIMPDVSYFGQKDAQQAIIIKKMVQDLNMQTKIRIMPIVRAKDGLVLSSRNIYLDKKQRKEAPILYKSLREAKSLIKNGQKSASRIISMIHKIITRNSSGVIDYVSIVDLENLEPVKIIKNRVLIALAVWFGKTRLIDNIII
ncbi:MAG: pantoate--beta-alanine ligase [Candidatus Omnitrophota bacterium]